MSDIETGKEAAKRLQDRLFDDEARLQGFQSQASVAATRVMLTLNGGIALALATWLQSSLSQTASEQQIALVPFLVAALQCCLAGLAAGSFMPFASHKNAHHSIEATAHTQFRMVNPSLGKSTDKSSSQKHRNNALKSSIWSERWRRAWYIAYGFSWIGFISATALVALGSTKAIIQ